MTWNQPSREERNMADANDSQPETSTPDLTERLHACRKSRNGCGVRDPTGIPDRYARWTLAHFPVAWAEMAVAFIEQETESMYLFGNVGSRKSSFAAATMLSWRWTMPASAFDSAFVPVYVAAARLRDLDRAAETMAMWQGVRLLVLDDIGAARSTPHLTEQLLFLIEYRYDWNAQTVITSNLTLEELAQAVNPRASSRLQQGLVLECGSRDWRRG